MDQELQQQIISRVDALAAKLGVAAGEMWEILVRQMVIDGTTRIYTVGFFLLVSIMSWAYFFPRAVKNEWKDEAYGVPAVIATFFLVIMLVVASKVGADGVKQLVNPEYYALKEITGMLGR